LDDGLVRDLGMSVGAPHELMPQMRASLAQY